MKKVFSILRAYSWPASTVPVIIGTVVAINAGFFSFQIFALTLAAALLVHSGANMANTYFDFKNGVDRPEFSDDRALVDSIIKPQTALKITILLFAAGACIGIYLAIVRQIPLLLGFGIAGFLLSWFYTAGTGAYKYKALGELGIFIAFGPFIVIGTALIQTGRFLPQALLVSAPPGLLITAILHANNMRDQNSDKIAGFKTLAGILGTAKSKSFFSFLIFTPFLLAAARGLWPAVFSLVSLPMAIKLYELSARENFTPLVKKTAQFLTVFGLLFAAGLWI